MDRWIGSKDDFKRFEGFKWYVWWELNMYIYIYFRENAKERNAIEWFIRELESTILFSSFSLLISLSRLLYEQADEMKYSKVGKINSNKQHACSSLSIVLARLASYFELRITRGLKEVDKKSSIIILKRDKSELYRFPSPALDTRAKARLSRK